MPLAALEAGLDWKWASFGEWLARLDGNVGVNAGFLVGHSTLRRLGHGRGRRRATRPPRRSWPAWRRPCTGRWPKGPWASPPRGHRPTTTVRASPSPPGRATIGELERLAAAVADHPGTTIEMIVPGCLNGFSDDEVELLTRHLAPVRSAGQLERAGRDGRQHRGHGPPARGVLGRVPGRGPGGGPDPAPHHVPAALVRARGHPRRTARVAGVLRHLDRRAHPAALSDPEVRRAMDERAQSDEAGVLRYLAGWARLVIAETVRPRAAGARGPDGRRGGRGRGGWTRGTPCAG